jgi:chromosome segregation ATPase
VTAYIQDWYQELGSRLVATEEPLVGFPREAVSLLGELWRIAVADRSGGQVAAAEDANISVLEAERGSLLAQIAALEVLNRELQHHRASAERSLAEARALLSRREGAVESGREQIAVLEQALATSRTELEVVLAQQRSPAAFMGAERRAAMAQKTPAAKRVRKKKRSQKAKPALHKTKISFKRTVKTTGKKVTPKRHSVSKTGPKTRG